jgi:hypothetical protein
MPVRIVVALDDRALAENVAAQLTAEGEDALAFSNSMVSAQNSHRANQMVSRLRAWFGLSDPASKAYSLVRPTLSGTRKDLGNSSLRP